MIVFIINMVRSIVFYISMKKSQSNKIIFIVFIITSLICGKIIYKNLYDILPILASLLSVIFTWQPSTKVLRFGQISICILWIIYDVFVMAYIGLLTESIIIISTIIALLNNDYEINLEMIVFKKYIKLRFRAGDDIINFSSTLPKVKRKLFKNKKNN